MTLPTAWLVVTSLFFYGWWDYHYVPLLVASIVFNYTIGKVIEKTGNKKVLIFGITVNVLLLGYFKYADFFCSNILSLTGREYTPLNLVLPLGISFFTFTQTAYLVDAYHKETRNDSFLAYCEFVTIFPHLIAGPLISHKGMMPQFRNLQNYKLNLDNIAVGICIFTFGLAKKVLVADQISPWVGDIFARTANLSLIEAWAGALGYTMQLYYDFSGYSEMAIGLGLLFNLQFPQNFNSPYQACSIIDFWRRWHMTLSSWVRQYIYIPLGGNRQGEFAKMRNLLLSMLIMGLWHGAGWSFIFWGALHGTLLMINHQWRRLNVTLPNFFNWILTFVCVVICWVFFRAANFTEAGQLLGAMVDSSKVGLSSAYWHLNDELPKVWAWIAGSMLATLVLKNPLALMQDCKLSKKLLAVITVLFVYALLKLTTYSEFLYFQF